MNDATDEVALLLDASGNRGQVRLDIEASDFAVRRSVVTILREENVISKEETRGVGPAEAAIIIAVGPPLLKLLETLVRELFNRNKDKQLAVKADETVITGYSEDAAARLYKAVQDQQKKLKG